MQYNDDFLAKWEHIIGEVSKTEVPLECLKKIVIRFHDKKQKTINLDTLKRQGLDINEIETVVSRTLIDLQDTIRDVDFIVDVSAVANIVQPQTDELLKGI